MSKKGKSKLKRETPDLLANPELTELDLKPKQAPPIFDNEIAELKLSQDLLDEIIGKHSLHDLDSWFQSQPHRARPQKGYADKTSTYAVLKKSPQSRVIAPQYSLIHMRSKLANERSLDWLATRFGTRSLSDASDELAGDKEAFFKQLALKHQIDSSMIPGLLQDRSGMNKDGGLSEKSRPSSSSNASETGLDKKLVCEQNSNALDNWYSHMKNRKLVQQIVKRKVRRRAQELVMNSGDLYCQEQEEKELIERAMPQVNDGKGCEHFPVYHQPFNPLQKTVITASFGSNVCLYQPNQRIQSCKFSILMISEQISSTLTKKEKGFRAPIESISTCDIIREEKALLTPDGEISYGTTEQGWDKPAHAPKKRVFPEQTYLSKRREQLGELILKERPFIPEAESLVIKGHSLLKTTLQNDGISSPDLGSICSGYVDASELESVEEEKKIADPFNGPALVVGGFQAKWSKKDLFHDPSDPPVSVLFEAADEQIVHRTLPLHNNGNCVIRFSWERIDNPSEINKTKRVKNKKFFLPRSSGWLRPGEQLDMPILFQSLSEGVYSELWQLKLQPNLGFKLAQCAMDAGQPKQTPIVISLFGISVWQEQHRYHAWKNTHPCTRLSTLATEKYMQNLIIDLIKGFRVEPPKRPVHNPLETEKGLFEAKNPTLQYRVDIVSKMHQLFAKVMKLVKNVPVTGAEDEPEEFDAFHWDLSVSSLKSLIVMNLSEARVEEYMSKLNGLVESLHSSKSSMQKRSEISPKITSQEVLSNALPVCLAKCDQLATIHHLEFAPFPTAKKTEPKSDEQEVNNSNSTNNSAEKEEKSDGYDLELNKLLWRTEAERVVEATLHDAFRNIDEILAYAARRGKEE